MIKPYRKIGTFVVLLGAVSASAQAQTTGACCLPNQTCTVVTQASCTSSGGAFQGLGTTCGTATCNAWISFADQTATRLPTGTGFNDAAITTADPREKDYAWGDFDHDGDLDVLVLRKQPLSCVGGYRNVLLMNENAVLMDRTSLYMAAAIDVPATQGVSQGALDATNDRQAVAVDVNNDGWLDIVTATTMSDGLKQYIGHPRVYMNLGSVGGVWQGFRYEYLRIPTLSNKTGGFATPPAVYNPRFCSVSAGDVNGDGYVDLYFVDYDTPENCYCPLVTETSSNDMDNKLLINQGASNPGYFNDESLARMGASCGCGGNLLISAFGAHGLIADMNGDGTKDVVKITTLTTPIHIAIISNPPANVGNFTTTSYKIIYNGAPYGIATGDINGDGKLDMIISDDSVDRYGLNTGNDGNGNPNVTTYTVNSPSEFSGQNNLFDLDNDGRLDAIIPDQDLDTDYSTARRTHFYHNLGLGANPMLAEDNVHPIIPTSSAKAVYQVAVFDINSDGWRDIILGRGNPAGGHTVGSTQVWISNGKPSLSFGYPDGRPASLTPETPTNFNVQLTGKFGGIPASSPSPTIAISVNGGAFSATALTSLGGDLYQATIPGQPCGVDVRYYITGQTTVGGTFTDPPTAPAVLYSAAASTSTTNLLTEDFESGAKGWVVQNDPGLTSGQWELGDPNGTWNEGYKAAPEDDASPSGTNAFVTGLGAPGDSISANDVDGGPTNLTSPTIDLAGSNATISFKHWFYSSTAGDVLQVSVSNDNGTNWVNVMTLKGPPVTNWNGPGEYTQTDWISDSFVVSDFVTPTAQVQVRFTTQDVAPFGIVEAGIDEFQVQQLNCVAPPVCPADINHDTNVNTADLLAVINAWGACPGCPADLNADGQVNTADLLLVINAWGACP